MAEEGKKPGEPLGPENSAPAASQRDAGVREQTPPPISDSDSPTMGHSGAFSPSPVPLTPPPSEGGLSSLLLLPPGTILGGRYRILRVLGQGGMGAVYQARDQELERIIALKVIRPELASNPTILQRFKQELILARHVTHKNVIRIYDLGEGEGIRFITMEYVDGEDLRSLLRQNGKFPPEQAVEIVQQICRALEAAHAEGVIHRDLKPQNVMRDSQGRIVVMDFGLARSLEAPGMTQTGALVGTLEYMSPEQAMGEELDQRSDLFAVGLIFYELLTGKAPFKADTGIATLVKRTKERAIPPSEIDHSVPKSLSQMVSACLERDRKHRYQSASELLRQLDTWHTNPNMTPSKTGRMSSGLSRSVQISLQIPESRGWMWAVGAALLIVLLLAIPLTRNLIFRTSPQNSSSSENIPELARGKYIAVLPLKVLGDEKSLNYVADGLVDALSAKLFQLREVHVAPSSAVEKVASKDEPLGKMARDLGANLVLQGTVQGSADRLRITLNLEDIAGGKRVWSQEFSGVSQDLLTLEDNIYADLVQALELKPSNEELARSGIHPTEDTDAYDLYLKGRNALRGNQGIRDTQASVQFLEAALKRDPNFALAYTGLADANLRLYKDKKDPLFAEKALDAAQRAERLNPNLAEVHLSLGSVYNATGKSAQAVDELKQALNLVPNSDEAYYRLGDAYLASGRKEEAISAYQSAVRANPYYWYNHNKLGGAYLQTGDTQKALESYKRVTELASDNPIGYSNIGAVYLRLGQYNEAIPPLQKTLELEPAGGAYSNLGTAYFFLKRYDEAVKTFEKAVEMSPKDEQLMGNLADSYRWSGQKDKAVETYNRAINLGYAQLQVNPRNSGVMGDLALYYAKKGDGPQAEQYIRQARTIDPSDLQLLSDEIEIYSLNDKPADALKSLREAFQKGYSPEEAQNDPELAKIKNLPEFQKLVSAYSKKTN